MGAESHACPTRLASLQVLLLRVKGFRFFYRDRCEQSHPPGFSFCATLYCRLHRLGGVVLYHTVLLYCTVLSFGGAQALEGQRDGLEHLMRIVKKDWQNLEVSMRRDLYYHL